MKTITTTGSHTMSDNLFSPATDDVQRSDLLAAAMAIEAALVAGSERDIHSALGDLQDAINQATGEDPSTH